MNQTNQIKCPECGAQIDVNEVLYRQLDEELKRKYREEMLKEREKYVEMEARLQKEKDEIAKQKEAYQSTLDEAIRKGVKQEKLKLEQHLKVKIQEEQTERFEALQAELEEKSQQVKELNKSKAEVVRLKREKEELRDKIELEAEQKLTAQLNEEREKIRKSEHTKVQLQISEKEKVIQQLKDQLAEAQRKAEQGSMQLQGEVLELAIEDWLARQFPLDDIEEIKKGQRGADCLQTVNTATKRGLGTIYYESKRTKSFQIGWIEKFKADIREKNADIGVLVTDVMPPEMERMGLKDGIWICSFEEFKGLCWVLRESVVRVGNAIVSQENKGEKMTMLYDFLTGNEFRMQVEAIVEGFTQMKSDLESEKRSMLGIWKKREKQIEKVLLNTNYMYSSIKGIAGSAVQPVALLELPAGKESGE